MAQQQIGISNASPLSLPLNTDGQINIKTGGFRAWNLDLLLDSTDASGTIFVYQQNTDPSGDTFTTSPTLTFSVTSGQFPGGYTRIVLDTDYLNSKQWVILEWNGSDISDGSLTISGFYTIF